VTAETKEPPTEAPAGPDSELARAQARIADLSREVALLRTPTEPPVPGKRVVGVLFLIIALALSTAFGIWAFARKPWAEKKLPPPPPAAAVVDEAGRAIVLALQSCVSAVPETEPVSIKLRVKIGGDGSTAVVEANVQPALEVLVPCARQSASAFHPARGDRDYDVLVLYEATREPTYRRMARWNWTVVEMNNSRLGLALPGFRLALAVGSAGGRGLLGGGSRGGRELWGASRLPADWSQRRSERNACPHFFLNFREPLGRVGLNLGQAGRRIALRSTIR
jgi:hypothetical protein